MTRRFRHSAFVRRRPLYVLVAVIVALGSSCTSVPEPLAPAPTTKPMSWLNGCWQSASGNVEETWTQSVHGDQLFGYSVTTRDGVRVFFEMMRIDITADAVTFSAYPRGSGPTVFNGKRNRRDDG